jgi:diacylglycerol O-acyltransferase / wax synthase
MRQLTSLDAQFLAFENQRQTGHVAGLAVFDPSTAPEGRLDADVVKQLIRDRLSLLPPLRWRLVEVPFGLDYPYWADDLHFDLDYHVRELALPAPGSDAQLAVQVARIMSRPLDRERPLWEIYVVHGLESGHTAVLTKIHHAVIDGMSGAEIMGILLDLSPEGRELPETERGQRAGGASTAEMLARSIAGVPRYPLRVLRSLPSAVPNINDTPLRALPGLPVIGRVAGTLQGVVDRDRQRPVGRRYKSPKTSFNGRVSPHRRVAFGQLPLDEVKEAKNAHGVTVNDVVVSLCAGAVRRWLLQHDELPEEPLVAQIPVSVRASEQSGTYGNRILLMAAPLFTNEPDPIVRLHRTHDAMRDVKERHRALPADLLQDANHFIPPAIFARASRLTLRLAATRAGRPNWNLVISNVPGPQIPLYMAGAKLLANYPISVITDGMGLNITVMSYMGRMDFGLVSDRDQMPDVWLLMDWLREELDALMPAKRAKGDGAPRARARRPASRSGARSSAK